MISGKTLKSTPSYMSRVRMKIAIFQHVSSEPAGYFETVFTERHIPYEYIRLDKTGEVPVTSATHFMFMGGPMSVNDEKELPYLKEEKTLIRDAVHNRSAGPWHLPWRPAHRLCIRCPGIPVHSGRPAGTGLCGNPKRRGSFQHSRCSSTSSSSMVKHSISRQEHSFLCTGAAVKNQAFSYKTAIGLQFHLELTDTIIREWTQDMDPTTREKILKETPRYIADSNRLCRQIAEAFIAQ